MNQNQSVVPGCATIVSQMVVVLFVISLVPLTTGCGIQRILRADFSNYNSTPSDDLLNGAIPGIPNGDSIQNAMAAAVVVDGGLLEGKSLRVQGMVDLLPATHDTPDEYMIDWSGYRLLLGNAGLSSIAFLDAQGNAALELDFDGSVGHLSLNTGTQFVPSIMLGNAPHVIKLNIYMGNAGRINFSWQESTDDVPHKLNNLAFLNGNFSRLHRIRFMGASNATYYVNDVDVFTRTKEMQ